jgi:hypothetical protein
MAEDLLVDPEALRAQVRGKYREVAIDPGASFHFHTGRDLAMRLSYDAAAVGALPDRAVESFAGVGNPFSLRPLAPSERVVDVGSGAGFDSFIAAAQVGPGTVPCGTGSAATAPPPSGTRPGHLARNLQIRSPRRSAPRTRPARRGCEAGRRHRRPGVRRI